MRQAGRTLEWRDTVSWRPAACGCVGAVPLHSPCHQGGRHFRPRGGATRTVPGAPQTGIPVGSQAGQGV